MKHHFFKGALNNGFRLMVQGSKQKAGISTIAKIPAYKLPF
jgi:hypothetical protein